MPGTTRRASTVCRRAGCCHVTAVSPLAPKSVPEHAGDRRRAARDRRGRHQVPGPHRRAAGAARRPAPRSPACSPARNARRRRSSGAAPTSRAARRARWWSIPATPTPSPARPGAQACQFTAKIAASAVGCKPADVFLASTGVIGEPLDASAFDGVMEGMVGDGARRRRGSTPPRRS